MTLEAFHKGDISKINLDETRGKYLVLIFYPADFTFICPTELAEAADLYEDFQKEGAEVMRYQQIRHSYTRHGMTTHHQSKKLHTLC